MWWLGRGAAVDSKLSKQVSKTTNYEGEKKLTIGPSLSIVVAVVNVVDGCYRSFSGLTRIDFRGQP